MASGEPSLCRIGDGETFWVETDDCYSGQITDASVKRPDIDISIMDCSVGPIAVQGAQPFLVRLSVAIGTVDHRNYFILGFKTLKKQ